MKINPLALILVCIIIDSIIILFGGGVLLGTRATQWRLNIEEKQVNVRQMVGQDHFTMIDDQGNKIGTIWIPEHLTIVVETNKALKDQ